MMWLVAAALSPAICAAAYERGFGALWQVASAVLCCVLCEAACLRARGMSPRAAGDGSAAVAGIIIGLSLPPFAPYYVAAAAAAFAMILAKHCYGGLGNNPFNPAMAGYALAFVSFPGDFGGWSAADAVGMPTPLSAARLDANAELPPPSYWLPLAAVVGGAALLFWRIADWRLPSAFLLGALLGAGGDWRALFAGGMMLAAFFVITDPTTAASTARGRWLYGFAAGALASLLRDRGPHADGIAFAILFCNMLAPLADMRRR